MNITVVMLVCIGGLVACATLVFAVETAVAYLLHDAEPRPSRSDVVSLPTPGLATYFDERRAA